MTKHIHIYLHGTRDAGGPAYAPAGSPIGGQFVSGSGGGGGSAKKASPVPHKLAHAMLKHENSSKKEEPEAKEPRGNSSDPKEREAFKKMQREKQAANMKTKSPEERAFHAKLAAGSSKTSAAPAKAASTSLTHQGHKYTATGKTGKHLGSGESSQEYERVDSSGARTGHRVWQTASGKIHED